MAMARGMGLTVEVAANGKIAIEMMHAHEAAYDVVLMDVQMPVMDGNEVRPSLPPRPPSRPPLRSSWPVTRTHSRVATPDPHSRVATPDPRTPGGPRIMIMWLKPACPPSARCRRHARSGRGRP
jgi:hypothetical protein